MTTDRALRLLNALEIAAYQAQYAPMIPIMQKKATENLNRARRDLLKALVPSRPGIKDATE